MTYQIELSSWGAECVAGVIPDNIWKYILDECEGDASLYVDKLDSDEVPEEFKLASDSSSFYDAHNFWHEYGPYDSTLTVRDDDEDEVVMTIESKDVPSETSSWSMSASEEAKGKPYFVWTSEEKGTWRLEIPVETDEPFDKSKLKLILGKLTYDNGKSSFEFISSVEYDGERYDVTLDSSTGKGYDTSFYQDED